MPLTLSNSSLKASAADHIEVLIASVCHRYRDVVQSPIEKMFLEAVVAYLFCNYGKCPKIIAGIDTPADGHWTVTPQAQIDEFRVDFLIEDTANNVRAVVECDGHDFHERTKDQARKDRRRDRELQAKGYLVLRYTGSEIFRDPWGCAVDVEAKIWDLSRLADEAA